MSEVKFYRGAVNILNVNVTDASYVNRNVMGDCTAYVEFMSPEAIELAPGDFTTILGHKYFVKDYPLPLRDVARLKYQLTLNGTVHELEKAIYFIKNSTGIDNTAQTSWFVTPLEFLVQLTENMERLQPDANWQVGDCMIGESKTIELSNNNCLEALQAAAELWDTHYDVTQNQISLIKIDSAPTLTLKVGKGLGLREITGNRSNNNPVITKLFAYGSDKNNPLGQNLAIPAVLWPGASEIIEGIHVFEDIFPQIVVTVTSVFHMVYDVTLGTDPIGFDINDYRIPGVNPRITFLSGELNGLTFNLDWSGQTTFVPIPYKEGGVVIPGATGYNPVVGDKFEIWGINMPEIYINDAKARLLAAALDYLANSQAKVKLNLTIDEIVFRTNSLLVECGMKIKVVSDIIPQFLTPGVSCEVLGYRRSILQPWKYDNVIVGDVLLKKAFDNRVEKVIERVILKQTEVITGVSDKQYTHTQIDPAAEWLVRHNLSKHPAVMITNDDYTVRDGAVTYLTPNTLKINFSVPSTGYVICN